jgi:branched-chain amino acid transport system permease protein
MDFSIAAILVQDGITSGAIYALLALALVLVFSVTRVIFIPQGEFVAFGALTLAAMQSDKFPGSALLLLALGVLTFVVELAVTLRTAERRRSAARAIPFAFLKFVLLPLGVYLLLIVAVGVHFALTGLGLLMFGAEGSRTTPFSDARIEFGALAVTGQSIVIIGVSLALIVGLYLYFERTLSGKALRATAVNRLGARLVGIGTTQAGRLAFTLAAAMGALCGVLIAPLTTVYYDSGFLIGLKGFVAAIIGGMGSYPVAAAGAILVGLLESYSSFWASAFKEVIVFTLIIPVLLWRSLTSRHVEEEEEE